MDDEELSKLLRDLVDAAVSVATNVEVIARAVAAEAERGEVWQPTATEYDE